MDGVGFQATSDSSRKSAQTGSWFKCWPAQLHFGDNYQMRINLHPKRDDSWNMINGIEINSQSIPRVLCVLGSFHRLSILLKRRKTIRIDNDKRYQVWRKKIFKEQQSQIVEDVIEKSNLKQGAIFVLGLLLEVIGGRLARESSLRN